METIFLTFIVLFIFWILCNIILKSFLNKYQTLEELGLAVLKCRKNIMFDIISLAFFVFFDLNFFTWIGIIYYGIMIIIEGILLVIALITGIDEDLKNKTLNKDLWLILLANSLNEISSILILRVLFLILN